MSYTFIEIEKRKTRIIKGLFGFLVLFYFVIAEILWLITARLFFIPQLRFNFERLCPIHPSIASSSEVLCVFLIALALAILHWLLSIHDIFNKILNILNAKEPDSKDSYHNTFKNIVEEVCVATGGHRIHPYVISTSGLNAFAISDFKGNAAIGVTEGLLANLNRSQLEAVIGHEAAHIVSGDSLSTTITCSLFGIYSAVIERIRETLKNSDAHGLEMGPFFYIYIHTILAILAVMQFINLLLNMFLSREKECRADAVAVRLTRNPIALAEALYIISRGWRGIGSIPRSLAPIFVTNPEYNELEESEGFIANLFSTHPPTERRLGILVSMAHAELKALENSDAERRRVQAGQNIVGVKEGSRKDWVIYKDNLWRGPFCLEELLGLNLTPSSWVAKLGEDRIKLATEDPALNELFRKHVAGKAIDANGLCPVCKQPLTEVLYEGAPLFRCHYCDGVLAHEDVVMRITLREVVEIPQPVKESADRLWAAFSSGSLKNDRIKVLYKFDCPKCGNKMMRGFYSLAYPIEADRCLECGYIWFDKGELETLQYLSEKYRRSAV